MGHGKKCNTYVSPRKGGGRKWSGSIFWSDNSQEFSKKWPMKIRFKKYIDLLAGLKKNTQQQLGISLSNC